MKRLLHLLLDAEGVNILGRVVEGMSAQRCALLAGGRDEETPFSGIGLS